MTKTDLSSAKNILDRKYSVQKALNEIAKTSKSSFAYFDKKETKFVSDSMEVMTKIANILDGLGIKFVHYFKTLNNVPELIIDPKYIDVAHELFDGWQSNLIVDQNIRVSNFGAHNR